MQIIRKGLFRRLILPIIYLIGILGIVSSGGGGGGDGDSDSYNCGILLGTITPATDGSGDVWIGGQITANLVSGAEPEEGLERIVRLKSDGTEAANYVVQEGDPQKFSLVVLTLAASKDGSGDVYVGGDFSKGIIRLNRDGTVDSGFSTGSGFDALGFDAFVDSIVPATDGSGDVYVSGGFSSYDGNPVNNSIARLDSNGTLDAGFDSAYSRTINAVATDGTNDVFVSGQSGYEMLWRLSSDGTLKFGFTAIVYPPNPTINPPVSAFSLATDMDHGDFYVGWPETIYRFNGSGSVDAGFSSGSGLDASSHAMNIASAMDGTGAIYVGDAEMTTYDSNPVNQIVRLNRDGSLDANFITGSGFDSGVFSIASAQDGTGDVYAGGDLRLYDGSRVNGLVRLNADGSLDTDFDVHISSKFGVCDKDS